MKGATLMEYPHIDRYAEMDSPIHSLDHRMKLVAFIILIFSFVFLPRLNLALIALFASLMILVISGLPKKFVLHRVKWAVLILLPLFFILPFTVEGRGIFGGGYFTVSYEGIYLASLIMLRAIAAVTLVVIMLATASFDTTIKALYSLKVPSTIVQILMFTYRYIFVITDEFQRMWKAIRSKGFRPSTGKYALSITGNLIGMLLVKSYDRAERVYQAMIAKGYTGKPCTIVEFHMKAKDYLAGIIIISVAIMLHIYHLVL
jgi:cobalt/nickel transport system permease protein